MISIQYFLPALLLFRIIRADTADAIVAQTFLSTGATEEEEFVQGLLSLEEEFPVEEQEIDNNLRLGAEASSPSKEIVIDFSSDVLEPYSEQAAILGEEAIAMLSVPRQANTGEYCAKASDCKSRVCILNRCCGSKKNLCRNLNCTAESELKECYVEDTPCEDQSSCVVNPICDYYNPCMFSKCSLGYTCQIVKSCILPPRASCVLVEDPCNFINCPPNAVCTTLESYPPKAVCNFVQEVPQN